MASVPVFDVNSKGKTQLMRLSEAGDLSKVQEHIEDLKKTYSRSKLARYIEAVDNDGDTAFAPEPITAYLESERLKARSPTDWDSVAAVIEAYYENLDDEWMSYRIKTRLIKLAATNPGDFLNHPKLFNILYLIANGNSEKVPVITILKNIAAAEPSKTILREKFEAYAAGETSDISLLRRIMRNAKVIEPSIFNMPAIMASEKPHVYALLGHGCVHMDTAPLTVPPGVIWIEMAKCGLFTWLGHIRNFVNPEMKKFLEETPIPIDEASRLQYRAFLTSHSNDSLDAKFPGERIAPGWNNLFAQNFDGEDKPTDIYFKSGIHKLYDSMDKTQYNAIQGKNLDTIYADSLYPTIKQIHQETPNMVNYRIEYEELFRHIESQTYDVKKPMILIQAGCRNSCLTGAESALPTLRRLNSEERQSDFIRKVSIEELLKTKPNDRSLLVTLIDDKMYDQIKILLDRLAVEIAPNDLILYLNTYSLFGSQVLLPHVFLLNVTDESYATKAHEAGRYIQFKMQEALEKLSYSDLKKLIPTKPIIFMNEMVRLSKSVERHKELLDSDFFRILNDLLNSRQHDNVKEILKNIAYSLDNKSMLFVRFDEFIRRTHAHDIVWHQTFKDWLFERDVLCTKGGARKTIKRRKHRNRTKSRRRLKCSRV